MMGCGFEVSGEDVENVLRRNWAKVANTQGKSFETMGEELLESLNTASIEKAALYGDEMEQQTRYAYEEIERQLRAKGILK